MTNRRVRHVALVAMIALMGCSQAPGTPATTTSPPETPSPTGEPSPTPTIQDIMEIEGFFAPLEPGTYFIDPDADPSTPLRVVYQVPVEGWRQWLGATRFAGDEHVTVSITTVTNLVRHGCRDDSPADPPVGSSVDDLATALADLAPFQVTSPPEDVTVYGYSGKHLELTVPDLPVAGDGFAGCVGGDLHSWFSPNHDQGDNAYFGYEGPGYTEEFWILDVEGSRLVVATQRTRDMPAGYIAELRAILDSIRIEP